jgi:hypothetical protein
MFCDPDQSQRNALYAQSGISEAEDAQNGFPLREREWLRRLEALLPNKSIVFICGANHISTFRQALSARGIATSIICEDFESAFAHN